MDKLEIIYPDGNIEFHDLDPNRRATNIGSHPENDIEIASLHVAPFHAVLNHQQRPYHLIVISRVGQTFLNGQPVQANVPVRLGNRAIVEMEGHRLILLEGAGIPAEPVGTPVGTPTAPPTPEPEPQPTGSPPPAGQQARQQPPSAAQPLSGGLITPPTTQPVQAGMASAFVEFWGLSDKPQDQVIPEIDISLSERAWTLDVGQTTAFELSITNGRNQVADYYLQIPDLPQEWLRFSSLHQNFKPAENRVDLNPGENGTIMIYITPPRRPDSRASTRYFTVKVESVYSNEEQPRFSQLWASLTINPYYEFSVTDLMPPEQNTTWRDSKGTVAVEITNLGNDDTRFRIEGEDRLQGCQFHVIVPGVDETPERQTDAIIPVASTLPVIIEVKPLKRRIFSFRPITYPLTISTTVLAPQPEFKPRSGELKNFPLFGPLPILLMGLVLLLLTLLITRPRINTFRFTDETTDKLVMNNTPVALEWEASLFTRDLELEPSIEGLEMPLPSQGTAIAMPVSNTDYRLKGENLVSRLLPSIFQPPVEQVSVKVAAMPPRANFEAEPGVVTGDDDITLRWEVQYADRVELFRQIGDGNVPELIGDFSGQTMARLQVTPEPNQEKVTYILAPSNNYFPTPTTSRKEVLIRPEIIFFNANPLRINQGEETILSWQVNGAQQVMIQGSDIGSSIQGPDHSLPVRPFNTTQYTLVVSGIKPRVVIIEVIPPTPTPPPPPPLVQRFDVTPLEITAGESVQVDWDIAGVDKVTILPILDGGELPPSGSVSETLEENTLFVLTASNGNSAEDVTMTRQVIVNPAPIRPEILNFEAVPSKVTRDSPENITLSWQINGKPESLELSGPGIGTLSLDPTQETFDNVSVDDEALFTLTASVGDLKDSDIVRIEADDPDPEAPTIIFFTAASGDTPPDQNDVRPQLTDSADTNRYEVTAGSIVQLSWRVDGSTSVALQRDGESLGGRPPQGEDFFGITSDTEFELIAKNGEGKEPPPRSAFVDLVISSNPPPDPPFNFVGNEETDSIGFTWNYVNPSAIIGFRIYRKDGRDGTYNQVANENELKNDAIFEWTDPGANPPCGRKYYIVAVYFDFAEQKPKETESGRPSWSSTPCAAP